MNTGRGTYRLATYTRRNLVHVMHCPVRFTHKRRLEGVNFARQLLGKREWEMALYCLLALRFQQLQLLPEC